MKKITLAFAVAALAIMAVASSASAGVQRYQAQTGQLTITLPGYSIVHVFDITMSPCDGSFSGVTSAGSPRQDDETITGTIRDGQLTFNSTYGKNPAGYQWSYTGAFDGGMAHDLYPDGTTLQGGFVITSTLGTLTDATHWKNHGDFVSHSTDKDDAAHSCIGMPNH